MTTHATGNERGSIGWIPVECVDWDSELSLMQDSAKKNVIKWKTKSEIQVAGMLSFFILTEGKHPFGPPLHRNSNLLKGNIVGLQELKDPVVKDLLCWMLDGVRDNRPYVCQALKHPYFLSTEDQMRLLEVVGNEREIKMADFDCEVVKNLNDFDESKPHKPLLPQNWMSTIGEKDLDLFCEGGNRPSPQDGTHPSECLRFIRNVFQHWRDRPRPKLKGSVSLEEYFLHLFPTLPVAVHQIIRNHPEWATRPPLAKFFTT